MFGLGYKYSQCKTLDSESFPNIPTNKLYLQPSFQGPGWRFFFFLNHTQDLFWSYTCCRWSCWQFFSFLRRWKESNTTGWVSNSTLGLRSLALPFLKIFFLLDFFMPLLLLYTYSNSGWQIYLITPFSSYFAHNNPVTGIGLRDRDRLKVTQPVFMPKVRLKLTVSWFLSWWLNHYTKLAFPICPFLLSTFLFSRQLSSRSVILLYIKQTFNEISKPVVLPLGKSITHDSPTMVGSKLP